MILPEAPHTRWSHQLRVQKWCWDVMPGLLYWRPGYSANSLAPGHTDRLTPRSCLGTLPSPLGSSSGEWMRALRTVILAPGPPEHPTCREPGASTSPEAQTHWSLLGAFLSWSAVTLQEKLKKRMAFSK